MNKAALRTKYQEKREALSQDEVSALSAKIFENFVAFFKPDEDQKIHCFLSIPEKNEVDTDLLLQYFFKNGIRVFVPKIVRQKLISVEVTKDTVFVKNSWGISEPESNTDSGELDFDIVITPLLYCDSHGNRVGYGKGFYDGLFEEINSETLKIGVGFFNPHEDVDDVWEKDIALDYLVTPTEVLSFGGLVSKSTK